uniref:Uncharacterized protein n=1 Tax=Cacopsylla melanoneura TaxID=428564 RepID=A0A8D9DXF2_9HEMI
MIIRYLHETNYLYINMLVIQYFDSSLFFLFKFVNINLPYGVFTVHDFELMAQFCLTLNFTIDSGTQEKKKKSNSTQKKNTAFVIDIFLFMCDIILFFFIK